MNRLELSGRVVAIEPLRHTPAGVPISSGRLAHLSEQPEAEGLRTVEMEVEFLAAGRIAGLLARAPLGIGISARGFLAARTRTHRQLVFHIVEFDLIGDSHGV